MRRTPRTRGDSKVIDDLRDNDSLFNSPASNLGRTNQAAAAIGLQHLVGRQNQITSFNEALDRCIAGTGSLLVVQGGMGSGRSTLLEHFRHLAAKKTQIMICSSDVLLNCSAASEILDSDLVVADAPLAAQSSPAFSQLALKTELAINPPHASGEVVAPANCDKPLSDVLFRFFQSRPTLILVDDFHKASPLLTSLICSLSRRIAALPLLIVASIDGSIAPTRATVELRQYTHVQLDIDSFTDTEICELLRCILRPVVQDEHAVAAYLQMLTAGNPKLTDRLVRDLVNSEAFSYRSGVWRLIKQSPLNCLSAAIAGICEDWTSRLSTLGTRVLKLAAVVGNQFNLDYLESISQTECDVSTGLGEARRVGLIAFRARDAYNHFNDYSFVHGVVRTYLYQLELPEIRRDIHGRAAAYLRGHMENIGRSAFSSMAEHYRNADLRESLDQALDYSIQAAERLMEVGNTSGAKAHLSEALAIAREHAGKQLRLAQILERLGWLASYDSLETAINMLQESLSYYEAFGKNCDAARLHGKLGTLLSVTYISADARRAAMHQERARQLLANGSDPTAAAALNLGVALCSQVRLSDESAFLTSSLSMEIADSHQDLDTWGMAAATRAYALWAIGHFREAFASIAFAKSRIAVGDISAAFSLALVEGFTRLLLWDPSAAKTALDGHWFDGPPIVPSSHRDILESHVGFAELYAGEIERAREISRRSTNVFLRAQIEAYEGRWSAAYSLLATELQRVREIEDNRKQWGLMFWLGRLYRADLNLSKAEQTLRSALTIGRAPLPIPHEVSTRAELVLILVQLNRLDEARVELARCHEIAKEDEDWRGIRGMINRAEGAWRAQAGDLEGSRREFESSRTIFELYGLPWEQAENDLVWGCCLLTGTKQYKTADSKFASAINLYEQYRFGQAWIDRVIISKEIAFRGSAEKRSTGFGEKEARQEPRVDQPGQLIVPVKREGSKIYDLVSTLDLALIATLTHDGIGHIVSCVDKIAKLHAPMTRIAVALEKISASTTAKTPRRSKHRERSSGKPSP